VRPRTLVLVSLLALVASRAPFFLHSPDWGGVMLWEECFLLSDPQIHANRVAVDPEPIPYWVVDPHQLRFHYHRGSACLSYTVKLLTQLLGTRSLVILKLIGTACTAVFVGLLAWALTRIWPGRESWAQVLVPLVLAVFPPVFFLWVTLTPQGHYYENHLIYALFLPSMIAASQDRPPPVWAVIAAGILGGLVTVYTFSSVVYVIALAIAYLLFRTDAVRHRLSSVAILGAVTSVVVVVLGRPAHFVQRLFETTPVSGQTGTASVEPVVVAELPRAALQHLEQLFGPHGEAVFRTTDGFWGAAVMACLSVILLAATGPLFLAAARSVHPRRRQRIRLPDRFLAIHALLLLGFLASYALFDPYLTPDGAREPMGYLVPIYPMLFLGAGALVKTLVRSRLSFVRIATLTYLAVLTVALIGGWANALRVNARPLERPEFASCDSLLLLGYFWNLQPRDRSRWSPGEWWEEPLVVFDHPRGEERCRRSLPGEEELCAYIGFEHAIRGAMPSSECLSEPPGRRSICARAVGASRHACQQCEPGVELPAGLCSDFEGDLWWDCVSGAYQSSDLDAPQCGCALDYFEALCSESFPAPADFSGCAEQMALLMFGMPSLPVPPEPAPPQCDGWPFAWTGLCARAAQMAARRASGDAAPSCEDVYREQYARALPARGGLHFDQCLSLETSRYPWCAVGMARSQGQLDCAWSGEWDDTERF
jgi:hypothetical protein